MNEFELIQRYFTADAANRSRMNSVCDLGNGDDCAILSHLAGRLAVSTDTVVAGRHVPYDAPASWLASRGLAAAVSDLAASGARPVAFTLALTLPSAETGWLSSFSKQLFASADKFEIALIGGDVTRGPLTASFTVFGEVPLTGEKLSRDAARPGDAIWVTGELGAAAAALPLLNQPLPARAADYASRLELLRAYVLPEPRIAIGLQLRADPAIHAAIDISDGLLADLRHIVEASEVTASLHSDSLPIAAAVTLMCFPAKARLHAFCGGDDYELLFTADKSWRPLQGDLAGLRMTCIGSIDEPGRITARPQTQTDSVWIDSQPAKEWLDQSGPAVAESDASSNGGFKHF